MSAAEPKIISSVVAAASVGLSATTVFFSLLIPALVLYYIYFRISRRHMIELADKLPGPDGLPLIGNALMLLGSSDSKNSCTQAAYFQSASSPLLKGKEENQSFLPLIVSFTNSSDIFHVNFHVNLSCVFFT